MKTFLVEKEKESQRIYNTVLLKPESLKVFSNGLSTKIIRELARQPQCAMDIARKLREHEQNIYYHLKRMRDAGLIRLVSEENRYGMTAKIYELVSPVIATKLDEEGYSTGSFRPTMDPEIEEFLDPFVKDGKLNAKIILGDPRPHGKYEAGSSEGAYISDLLILIGNFVSALRFPSYKLDSYVDKNDLKDNMIIIGSPKVNSVAEKINSFLPIYFKYDKEWSIVSKLTGKVYNDDFIGIIVKCDNPFRKGKKILFLGGRKGRGAIASTIAITQFYSEILKGNESNSKIIARVVMGIDKNSDGFIDSINIIE